MPNPGMLRGLIESAKDSIYGERDPRAKAKSEAAVEQAQDLGIFLVGWNSKDERVEDWVDRLWHDQDDLVQQHSREWAQHIYYVANHQFITYHGGARRWLTRKAVPWRVRSVYNVTAKALKLRVSRLTENKPTVTVQAATTEREDIERAEYKETLFWYLWEKLSLHQKVVLARRWAAKCGTGFLKVGWDPDAGPDTPVTKMIARYEEVDAPLLDEMGQPVADLTGQPVMRKEQLYKGLEEVYLDAKKQELGPVFVEEEDPESPGETRRVRQDPPEGTDFFNEGEAYVSLRTGFNLRWDRFTDEIHDSWYVQDSEVAPLSQILAWFPDKKNEIVEKLKEAEAVSAEDDDYHWQGLTPRVGNFDGHGFTQAGSATRNGENENTDLDREYVVRETWIFPKNQHLKKLWGRRGCILVTVGGKLIAKLKMPDWALRACPFVAFVEDLEEGNHYNKPFLRDIVPLQDDINRTRSHKAEAVAASSRMVLGAPQNHQIRPQVLQNFPGVLVTYRSKEHKPESLDFRPNTEAADSFYDQSIAAVADLGNMNDASTGKLPSAGIAAKAIYALQYADERSTSEVSNLQDGSLKRLAVALDEVTRHEYTENRKIRLVGRDRSYMVELDLSPQHLQTDVHYHFVPGSMLSRQKESVRNEMLSLMQAGLMQPWEVKKNLPTAVPDAFRGSYDQHEAKARRNLQKLRNGEPVIPQPWDKPEIHLSILEEFMLSAGYDTVDESVRARVEQLWQAFQLQMQGAAPAPVDPATGAPAPIPGQEPGAAVQQGPDQLAQLASQAMAPPPGFGEAEPAMMN